MKIAALSLGLAVVAVVAAQAADPLAANGAQTNYEWAQPADQAELISQLEESYSLISELEFRSQILARLEEQPAEATEGEVFNAEYSCPAGYKVVADALKNVISTITGFISMVPGLGSVAQQLNVVVSSLEDAVKTVSSGAIFATLLTVKMVIGLLNLLQTATLGLLPSSIKTTLDKIETGLGQLSVCVSNSESTQGIPVIDNSSCYEIADLYRAIVAEVVAGAPTLPADASEDLQRYFAGAQAILQIINKNSIAAKNEALLNTRPIFAAELLDEYRIEIVRSGAKDAIQTYAAGSMGLVIGSSNALEACLRVAADPVVAAEELNEELDALEDEDEADEDEDDEPEADEAEAAPAEAAPAEAAPAEAVPQAAAA
ncbi:hypothetical protein EC991_008480 [Linnemannia zychae]|nr:hypothetical protein EC991_008480 [Linnemannia zychae]